MTSLSQQENAGYKQISIADLSDGERQACEVWTRVMGYHRPISSFNAGKKSEFAERTYFCEARVEGLSTTDTGASESIDLGDEDEAEMSMSM